MTSNVVRVKTGFLSGNLGDGCVEYAVEYAAALREALRAAYPKARVDVFWADADGVLPARLRTLVEYDEIEDSLIVADEETRVDQIAADVYATFTWLPADATESRADD